MSRISLNRSRFPIALPRIAPLCLLAISPIVLGAGSNPEEPCPKVESKSGKIVKGTKPATQAAGDTTGDDARCRDREPFKPTWLYSAYEDGYRILYPHPRLWRREAMVRILASAEPYLEGPLRGVKAGAAGNSCISCHANPALGGRGVAPVNQGSNDSAKTPLKQMASKQSPLRRVAIPFWEVSLIEAVEDSAIADQAARQKGTPIAGQLRTLSDGRIGRFGVKARFATLAEMVAAMLDEQMGVSAGPTPLAQTLPDTDGDGIREPELTDDEVQLMAAYLRRMLPPIRKPAAANWKLGQSLFIKVGCADCHVPSMPGPANTKVPLYSDLLLHDMGPRSSDPENGPDEFDKSKDAPAANRFRTAPLLGLVTGGPFLHDGSAPTIEAAILAHDGQAGSARDRFSKLRESDRYAVIKFLQSIEPWSPDLDKPIPDYPVREYPAGQDSHYDL